MMAISVLHVSSSATVVPALLADGFGGYLVLLGLALVAHEPWRWLGLGLGSWLTVDSRLFTWVKYVATALIAALVMRLMVFPSGAFAKAPPELRLGVFVLAIGVFWVTGRQSQGIAIMSAAAAFLGGMMVLGM